MPSWRTTLFVWSGPLTLSVSASSSTAEQPKVAWTGRWLPSDDRDSPGDPLGSIEVDCAEPPPVDSDGGNPFSLTGSVIAPPSSTSVPSSAGGAGFVTVELEGSYTLDNGAGPESFSDTAHTLVVALPPSPSSSSSSTLHHPASASGTTEFGPFVSLGYLSVPPNQTSGVLTLARRYVTPNDARTKVTASERLSSLLSSRPFPEGEGGRKGWIAENLPLAVPRPKKAAGEGGKGEGKRKRPARREEAERGEGGDNK